MDHPSYKPKLRLGHGRMIWGGICPVLPHLWPKCLINLPEKWHSTMLPPLFLGCLLLQVMIVELCDLGHVIVYDSQFYTCKVIVMVFPNIVTKQKKPQILTSVCTYSISAKQAWFLSKGRKPQTPGSKPSLYIYIPMDASQLLYFPLVEEQKGPLIWNLENLIMNYKPW